MDSATIIALFGLFTTAAVAIAGPLIQAWFQARTKKEEWERERRLADAVRLRESTIAVLRVASQMDPAHGNLFGDPKKLLSEFTTCYFTWEIAIWPFLDKEEREHLSDEQNELAGSNAESFYVGTVEPLVEQVRFLTEETLHRRLPLF